MAVVLGLRCFGRGGGSEGGCINVMVETARCNRSRSAMQMARCSPPRSPVVLRRSDEGRVCVEKKGPVCGEAARYRNNNINLRMYRVRTLKAHVCLCVSIGCAQLHQIEYALH